MNTEINIERIRKQAAALEGLKKHLQIAEEETQQCIRWIKQQEFQAAPLLHKSLKKEQEAIQAQQNVMSRLAEVLQEVTALHDNTEQEIADYSFSSVTSGIVGHVFELGNLREQLKNYR